MKNFLASLIIVLSLAIAACGGKSGKKESAASIAQQWCDLNAKVHKAPDGGPEYGKAKEAREKYESEMKEKYGKDEALMKQIDQEIEKCEDASEGR